MALKTYGVNPTSASSDPKRAELRDTMMQITAVIGDMEAKARVLAGLLDNVRRNNIADPNVRDVVSMKASRLSDEYVTMRQAMTRFVQKANDLLQGSNAILR
jgi:hypothetical protein